MKDLREVILTLQLCVQGVKSSLPRANNQASPYLSSRGLNTPSPCGVHWKSESFDEFSNGFKSLLNTLHLDVIGNLAKSDPIVLMVSARTHTAIKRKKDKIFGNITMVRSRMRLMSRVYLTYRDAYCGQSSIVIENKLLRSFQKKKVKKTALFQIKGDWRSQSWHDKAYRKVCNWELLDEEWILELTTSSLSLTL